MSENEQTQEKEPDAGTLWLPIAEVARMKGVERTTVWEKVKRLAEDGRLETRKGKGKRKLINLAQYDRLVGETTDPAHQQAADMRQQKDDLNDDLDGDDDARENTYSAAARRKMQYEADLRHLDLLERRKLIVPVAAVTAVVQEAADAMVGVIERLLLRAEELTAAAQNNGIAGVRAALKKIIFNLRSELTGEFRKIEQAGLEEEARGTLTVEIPHEVLE